MHFQNFRGLVPWPGLPRAILPLSLAAPSPSGRRESFLLGKTPPAGGGGTQVPKGERLSSECETERLYEEQLHLELTAIETLFVRVRVSLCFSFSSVGLALSGADAPAVPLFGFAIFPRPGEIFPKGGALGKEGKLFLYPLYSFALAIC